MSNKQFKINKETLESLKPCRDRWDNYLKHYSGFEGSFSEFLDLDKITTEDKIWVFTGRIPTIERKQRDFALICADRATFDYPELQDFFYMSAIINISEDFGLLEIEEYQDTYHAARNAAYQASCQDAAFNAAYQAAAYQSAFQAASYHAAYQAAYKAYAFHAAFNATTFQAAAYQASCQDAAFNAAYRAEREIHLEIIKSLF